MLQHSAFCFCPECIQLVTSGFLEARIRNFGSTEPATALVVSLIGVLHPMVNTARLCGRSVNIVLKEMPHFHSRDCQNDKAIHILNIWLDRERFSYFAERQ